MLSIQRVATLSGITFLAVSALGFAAGAGGHPMLNMHTGMLLGLFPVNVLHNAVHMLFGVWGIWAGWSARRSVVYTLASGAVYLVLAIFGMITPSLLGIVPLGGYDVVLHLLLAVALAGAGFWAMWFAPTTATQRVEQPRRAA
ncbi:MAG TPA: DUF4383 domain-containing protein [Gemmatimonadaceae bacterium]|nr:DUF4383 domain-containing protein [Gemmatimonadaceae bacterium]